MGESSQSSVASIERENAPSPPERLPGLDDEIVNQHFPPRAGITRRASAPSELPPARDNRIIDQASILLDMLELRETASLPSKLPSQEGEQ